MPITVLYGEETGDEALMGTGQLKGVKSEYIREKIRNTPFKKRAYIYGLVSLYRYVTGGVNCGNSARAYGMLKCRYPGEYLELLKENSPKEYREELKKHKAEEAEARRETKKDRDTIEKQKREWLAAGGRV
jgi:hypothetical protein